MRCLQKQIGFGRRKEEEEEEEEQRQQRRGKKGGGVVAGGGLDLPGGASKGKRWGGRKEKLVIGFCRGGEERYRHKGKRRGEDPFFPWPIFLRESRVQQRGLFLLAVCAREMKFAPLDRFVFFSLGSNMVFFCSSRIWRLL